MKITKEDVIKLFQKLHGDLMVSEEIKRETFINVCTAINFNHELFLERHDNKVPDIMMINNAFAEKYQDLMPIFEDLYQVNRIGSMEAVDGRTTTPYVHFFYKESLSIYTPKTENPSLGSLKRDFEMGINIFNYYS